MNDKNIDLWNAPNPQLYNLKDDPGEQKNLAELYPLKLESLKTKLKAIKEPR